MYIPKDLCNGEHNFFKKMRERCKVSCEKLIALSIVVKEDTNTLIFYIFKCDAKYGAECSAEPSAK